MAQFVASGKMRIYGSADLRIFKCVKCG